MPRCIQRHPSTFKYSYSTHHYIMAPVPLDDIIVNQTNVHLARCQRLISSWLPPPSAGELEQAKTEAEREEEDKRIFVAEPEMYARTIVMVMRSYG